MTATASRFDQFHSDSFRLVPIPSATPSSDGASPPENGAAASDTGGEDGAVVTYNRALIARVQLVCAGYKPGELADRMGLHPETVRRYLRGQKPTPEFLAGICRELDVSAHWLLMGEGPMRPG